MDGNRQLRCGRVVRLIYPVSAPRASPPTKPNSLPSPHRQPLLIPSQGSPPSSPPATPSHHFPASPPQHSKGLAMSALGALSGGAAGVAGLLSLRRRAAAPPPPSALASSSHLPPLKCAAVPDAGHLVWGRQLRPALALLPFPSQAARKQTPRPPAAASAGSLPSHP